MINLRPKKLSTSFLLPVLFTIFLTLMMTTIYDAYTSNNRLLNELEEKAAGLLDISSASASDAFWSYNNNSLREIADSLLQYKEITEVTVLDEDGRLIYRVGKSQNINKESYRLLHLTKSVYKDGPRIGEFHVEVTTYYLAEEIKNDIISGFIQTIIIIFIIFIIILLLSRNITDSIDRINESVTAFSEGDTESRISIKNRHEISALSSKINTMFDTIVEGSKKLSENYLALQNKEEALRITEERFRYAVEGSNDAIWDWNLLTGEYYVSSRGAKIIGLTGNEIIDLSTWMSFIHPQDIPQFQYFLDGFMHQPDSYRQLEFRVTGSNGEIRWLFCRGKGILNQEKQPIRVSGFYTDITERIKAEEAINRLAYYDVLTGLPNRALLLNHLKKLFIDQKSSSHSGALLFMDLDDFKTINDTKGHAVGDQILVEVAKELNAGIKCDIIARFGGDEFVILLTDCDASHAGRVSEEIIDLIKTPRIINDHEFTLSCSIGIAFFPEDGTDIDNLLMKADSAMYQAKEQGKDQFKFFEQSMNDQMVERLQLQKEIRQGIINKEFILHYQPQVDLKTGRVIGVEALVRWNHPSRGLLSPMYFIELAEETGLIIPLGEYILKIACRQSVAWEQEGHRNIIMSVNMSARQFIKKTLVKDILKIIKETNMRPELLNLEITETLAMENLESSVKVMKRLRAKGIAFSLDDFGTGYSSLTYLKNMHINYLKIDKHFVQNIHDKNFEEVLIKAIIEIAHSMNLIVVAEGIETIEQIEALKNYNCDQAQGFYFCKPLPSGEVEKTFSRYLS